MIFAILIFYVIRRMCTVRNYCGKIIKVILLSSLFIIQMILSVGFLKDWFCSNARG